MRMLFISTIELTYVVVESVNLISYVIFAEVQGRTCQVWIFLGFFGHFSMFCGSIGGHKDYFPFIIFNFCIFDCNSTIASLQWFP